jgi:hypothetical protein
MFVQYQSVHAINCQLNKILPSREFIIGNVNDIIYYFGGDKIFNEIIDCRFAANTYELSNELSELKPNANLNIKLNT